MSLKLAPIPGSSALASPSQQQQQQHAHRASNLEKQGCLEATVLSVYDLPFGDRPVAVELSSCGIKVSSGGPIARHKDRNSYRFATTAGSSSSSASTGTGSSSPDVIKLVAPLRDLYRSMLTVRVTFAKPGQYLETELPIRQLRIHENKWLILNLTPSPGSGTTSPTAMTTLTATSPSAATTATVSSLPEEDSMAPPPTIRIKLKLSGS
jgi:hypothetical protein